MKKYCVTFRWYRLGYSKCDFGDLIAKRSFFVKATSTEEAVHTAHERCDIDTNEMWVDEICVKDLSKTKHNHIKKRFKLQYKYYPVLYV